MLVTVDETIWILVDVSVTVVLKITVLVTGNPTDAVGGLDTPSPQVPNAGLHPAPQYDASLPQNPYSEQHSPKDEPVQVTPIPQVPSMLTWSAAPAFWARPKAADANTRRRTNDERDMVDCGKKNLGAVIEEVIVSRSAGG